MTTDVTSHQTARPDRYDAIIVGSGIGGLVCGGYLAADGRRVLVLEQHDVAGGNAHVFRRRRRYEFDVGTHYLGDCGTDGIIPAILSGLGVGDRVRFRPMDNERGFDRVITPPPHWMFPRLGQLPRQAQARAARRGTGIDTFIDLSKSTTALSRASVLGEPVVDLYRANPR
ncbi:NAD(P)-binding protein [Streptomyces sp. FXJ1.4098]|nr:NAD(P)-binding protein [Streptomyces sp. FXJ1.4098]